MFYYEIQQEKRQYPLKKDDTLLTASLQSCLGLVLTGDQTEKYLKNALRLNTSFFGPSDLHTALK